MIGKVMEFGMNVGTEQFRGLSQTSPRTIRDAEENQHGAIVASTALEQIMRLSIGIGLCEPWQPPAWMDFVVLEMDIIIPSLCVRYGNIQSRGLKSCVGGYNVHSNERVCSDDEDCDIQIPNEATSRSVE